MSDFINGLIERHSNLVETVRPRIPGIYESGRLFSIKLVNLRNAPAYNYPDNLPENLNFDSGVPIEHSNAQETNNNELYGFLKSNPHLRNDSLPKLITNSRNSSEPNKSDEQTTALVDNSNRSYNNEVGFKVTRKAKVANNDPSKSKSIKTIDQSILNENLPPNRFIPGKLIDDSSPFKDNSSNLFVESLIQQLNNKKSKSTQIEKSNNIFNNSGRFKISSSTVNKNADTVNVHQNKTSLQLTPPSIKINIGRIEVKALKAADNIKQPQRKQFKPKLSLDDYLRQRDGIKG